MCIRDRYTAVLRQSTYSLSAHAKDIWTTPIRELRRKLASASWAVTCTRNNLQYLLGIAPAADISLLYHGVDAEGFVADHVARSDLFEDETPIRLGCVARAVPKKGLSTMLEALSLLPSAFAWTFEHAGGGPEVSNLRRQAERLNISDKIDWLGPLRRDDVARLLKRVDLFCLPAMVGADGDRDGLPNVILEAMASGVPVIATRVSAIPEAIDDGKNGVLVPSSDPHALADAILGLGRDPERRAAMARAAQATIAQKFSSEAGIVRLATRLAEQVSRVDRACG